jgi:3-oxoacyl-[acyl-carrier protein] reductase
MDLQLANRLALVTGASSGIGAATAQILAEEGADVIISYCRNLQGAERTADRVRRAGRRARLLQMDIGDAAAVSASVEQLQATEDRIGVLVLCAGENALTAFEQVTPDEWGHIINTNLNGPFYVLRAVLPLLEQGASVVIVASVAAHTGAPHHAHYAAAKAGLVNLTKSAARALAPRVRVNCIAPGMTDTAMGKETMTALPSDYPKAKLLSQRVADAEEIARCIAFVASPISSFMFGATIDINGGRELR